MTEICATWPLFDTATIDWILGAASLTRLLDRLDAARDEGWRVVADLETTGLNEHAPNARIACLGLTVAHVDKPYETYNALLPLSHPEGPWFRRWREVLTQVSEKLTQCQLIGQNVRFDARWIYAHTGVDLSGAIAWDTGLSSHLLDENSSSGLKQRAVATFPIEAWNEAADWARLEREQLRDPDYLNPWGHVLSERIPLADLGVYCVYDTYWTWALASTHLQEMVLTASAEERIEEEYGGDPDEETRLAWRLGRFTRTVGMPMIRTITDMEQRGWLLDREWTEEKLAECRAAMAEGYAALEAMTPGCPEDYEDEFPSPRSYAPTALWFKRWADLQMEAGQLRVIATSGKTGQPSWSKGVLKRLRRTGSTAAQKLLDYRDAEKQAQFLQSWLDLVAPDSRIYSTYSYGKVITGRTSSSNPNMQQCTARLKPAFMADEGKVLIDADLSQIEPRIAAHISGCEPMIEAYRTGQDLHRLMGAQIFNIAPADLTDAQRQHGKVANLSLLYMMSAGGLQHYADEVFDVVLTIDEAERMHAAYFELWDGLGVWHMRQIRDAERSGYVVSPLGRIRRLPEMLGYMDDYLRDKYGKLAVNSPIQSCASDVLQMGASKIRREVPQFEMLGMVHDSVIGQVPIEMAAEVGHEVWRCMTQLDDELAGLGVKLRVPLDADVKISARWGEGVKLSEWE